jgi:hypothetical protein
VKSLCKIQLFKGPVPRYRVNDQHILQITDSKQQKGGRGEEGGRDL